MHPPDTLAVPSPSDAKPQVTRAFDAPRHLVFAAFTHARPWCRAGCSARRAFHDARVRD